MNYFRSTRVWLALAVVLASGISFISAAEPAATLNTENMDAWKAHILPTEDEVAWTKIPWLPDLQSGIDAATESGKPVLLWTMNGHPLGCT